MNENAQFVHFTRGQRAQAWISSRLFSRVTYTARHGLTKGMRRRGGLGWLPERFAGEASAEQRFLEDYDFGGLIVYDVGAFHGLLTMFFARRAARVVAFEPNSANLAKLSTHVALNKLANVIMLPLGLGATHAMRSMTWDPLTPGAAQVDAPVGMFRQRNAENIEIMPLDEAISAFGLPTPNFIKIDVEGLELEVLRGAEATLRIRHPRLFMEMHGETIAEKKRKVGEIVDFLWSVGYRSITHIETDTPITRANCHIAMRGHLYAE